MMSQLPSKAERWAVTASLDRQKLRELAGRLRLELDKGAAESAVIAELAKFAPLTSAIQRAESDGIFVPEVVQGMTYWYLHTELPAVISLLPSLSEFLFMIEGWQLNN